MTSVPFVRAHSPRYVFRSLTVIHHRFAWAASGDPAHAERLRRMKLMLTAYLDAMGRPFGEFVPGGNAAAPGQVDKQIEWVKQLEIQHKDVTVPPELKRERNR